MLSFAMILPDEIDGRERSLVEQLRARVARRLSAEVMKRWRLTKLKREEDQPPSPLLQLLAAARRRSGALPSTAPCKRRRGRALAVCKSPK